MAKINKNCMILFNATAGYMKISPKVEVFARIAKQVGLDTGIVPTKNKAEMMQRIKEYKDVGVKKIVVAGGDGTVAAAVQEMAYSNIPFGIIPLGTYNNFATALRLPPDIASAMRAIKVGDTKTVSLGKANDTYFTESAGVGLFADALDLYGIGRSKNIFLSAWAILRLAYSLPTHRVNLTIDGKPYMDKAVMCTVANSFRMGAALPIAPEARLTDDVLDLVIIGDLTYSEIIPYYKAVRSQMHPALPKVTVIKAKEVTIESLWNINVHADDSVIGQTPTTITIAPKALRVIVDRL
jgi:diacylglycerol kinase (ATP)